MAQPIPFPRTPKTDEAHRRPRARIDVPPPALWPKAGPGWLSITRWLRGLAAAPAAPDVPAKDRLSKARDDFAAALADVPGTASGDLQTRVRHARSLRELWHLRAELFSVVSRRYSQREAQRRLASLNRHFPTQAPRHGEHRAA